MSVLNYIGAKISLISRSDIRYVGILHSINSQDSTVALEQVRSFGTEGRKGNVSEELPATDHVFEYIVFRGSDIKDLQVYEPPAPPRLPPQMPDDPAILGTAAPRPPGFYPGYSGGGRSGGHGLMLSPNLSSHVPGNANLNHLINPTSMNTISFQQLTTPHSSASVAQSQQQSAGLSLKYTQNVQVSRKENVSAKLDPPRTESSLAREVTATAFGKVAVADSSSKEEEKAAEEDVDIKHSSRRRVNKQKKANGGRKQGIGLPAADFDFVTANEKFGKLKLVEESKAKEAEVEAGTEPKAANSGAALLSYDRNKSFFDDISCEVKERKQELEERRKTSTKERREEERKINVETFGAVAARHFNHGTAAGRGRACFNGRGRGYVWRSNESSGERVANGSFFRHRPAAKVDRRMTETGG